jgi:hypothetical protein
MHRGTWLQPSTPHPSVVVIVCGVHTNTVWSNLADVHNGDSPMGAAIMHAAWWHTPGQLACGQARRCRLAPAPSWRRGLRLPVGWCVMDGWSATLQARSTRTTLLSSPKVTPLETRHFLAVRRGSSRIFNGHSADKKAAKNKEWLTFSGHKIQLKIRNYLFSETFLYGRNKLSDL